MSFLMNLLWFVLGGFLVFLFYLIGGIVLCCTIVGIPFGVQLIKLSVLGLAPFGREINTEGVASGVIPLLMNILWWVFGGFELAVTHLVFALILGITIVGLPFAKQHLKLVALALVPFGARIE